MKQSNVIYAGLLMSVAALSACSDNDLDGIRMGDKGIQFSSTISGMASRAIDNQWQENDRIGISMLQGGNFVQNSANVQYSTNSAGDLKAEGNAMYYPDGNVDFVAYYPYQASAANGTVNVSVADQSNQAAIDLLYSNNAKGKTSADKTVGLNFTHQLTKLVFNVSAAEGIKTDNLTLTVKGLKTTATFAVKDGKLTTTGNAQDIKLNYDAAKQTAVGIVLPSALDANTTLTVSNAAGKSATTSLTNAASEFAAGTQYTIPVRLNKGDLPSQINVTFGQATISDWKSITGGDLNFDFSDQQGGGTETPADGDGTKEKPYSVAQVIAKQDKSLAWVKAYIVGSVSGNNVTEGMIWGASDKSSTSNIVVATTPDEKDVTKCIPVQLTKGDIRNGLNTKDNAGNIGKEVLLYGSLENYFGKTPGLKNVTAASFDGGKTIIGKEPGGTVTPPETGAYILGEAVAPADITAGTYAIGYTYNGTNYLMKHKVYSQHYIAALAYTTGGNVDNSCIFTLTKSGNGFTIKGYDGKYVGVSINGNYTNLVPTEEDGSTIWTLAAAPANEHDMENDCKMTSNKSSDKFLIFSWYNKTSTAEYTMGTYSSKYANRYPVFYKLIKK